MLDRLPAHVIESILLCSNALGDEQDERDTRALAKLGTLCRRMRDPARRAALHDVIPHAGLLALLEAQPEYARDIRAYRFVPPRDVPAVQRTQWFATAARTLRLAQWARRVVIDAEIVHMGPVVIAAMARVPWRDVSVRIRSDDEIRVGLAGHHANLPTPARVERIRQLRDIVEAIAAYAVRLEVDVSGIAVGEQATEGMSWPVLPKLRSLVLLGAELETFALFAALGPYMTSVEVSLGPSLGDYDTVPSFDLEFAKLPAARTITRLVIRNGVHSNEHLDALPQLTHLDISFENVGLSVPALFDADRPLPSVRLRADDETHLTILVALVHLLISKRRAFDGPPFRDITLVHHPADQVDAAALEALRQLCQARGIWFERLLTR